MKKLFGFMLSTVITALLLSVFATAASTSTVLTRTCGKIKCTVMLDEVPAGSVIVVSAFKDGVVDECFFRTVTNEKTEEFSVDGDTNEVRVFVFEDMTSISPVTPCERIEIKMDSVTDPDWSDWI